MKEEARRAYSAAHDDAGENRRRPQNPLLRPEIRVHLSSIRSAPIDPPKNRGGGEQQEPPGTLHSRTRLLIFLFGGSGTRVADKLRGLG
jgi:hypothetical protein